MITGIHDLHVGIDYSLTSPAVTECDGEWKYKNIKPVSYYTSPSPRD